MRLRVDKSGRLFTSSMHVAPRKPTRCPVCASRRMAGIVYGLVAPTPKLDRELAEGKIVLGGCCIGDNDPAWQCVDCGVQVWRTE